MKTTIDIADGLLESAKRVAAREKTTLRALIEEGICAVLQRRRGPRSRFELRDASFRGQGVQPGVDLGDWDAVTAMIYDGRGG